MLERQARDRGNVQGDVGRNERAGWERGKPLGKAKEGDNRVKIMQKGSWKVRSIRGKSTCAIGLRVETSTNMRDIVACGTTKIKV